MKLSSFLIGMFVTAGATAIAVLALGGSLIFAVAMWFAALVVAQLLYTALLVAMARFAGDGQHTAWADGGAQGVFAHQGDFAKPVRERSGSPKA